MRRGRGRARGDVRLLLTSSGAALALWFVPYAEVVIYPIRLFVTLVHESAHAVAAVLTGGSVSYVQLHWDGGGITVTQGGMMPIISSAGYVGTTLYGSALLAWGMHPRRARLALGLTAVGVIGITLAFVRPVLGFGFGVGMGWGVLLGLLFRWASIRSVQFLVGFLAVQSCLNALFDLRILLALSISGQTHTDAQVMEDATFVPAVAWAVAWGALSLGILLLALRRYGRAR